MSDELGSTHAQEMIKTLLNVHALTNMHRSSGNDEYRKTAAEWLPTLDWQLKALRDSLAIRATPVSEREEG